MKADVTFSVITSLHAGHVTFDLIIITLQWYTGVYEETFDVNIKIA